MFTEILMKNYELIQLQNSISSNVISLPNMLFSIIIEIHLVTLTFGGVIRLRSKMRCMYNLRFIQLSTDVCLSIFNQFY